MTIVVQVEAGEYKASIEKRPEASAVGKTASLAIGELVQTHAKRLKIKIKTV